MHGDAAPLVIAHILPLAAGAAVSPAVLGTSVEILVAFGKRGRWMLLAYLVGAAAVVVAAMGLSLLVPRPTHEAGGDRLTDIVDIVFAGVLAVLALFLLLRPSGRPHRSRTSGLLSSRWAAVAVLGLGAVMMATNISTLVLVLAGSREVSAAQDAVVAIAGYGLLLLGSLLPILLPLAWVTVRPAAAARELQRVDAFISKRGRMLGVIVCAVTAAYLLLRGLGVL